MRDIPGVLALLKANHADNVTDKTNGFVTTNMTEEQMAALIRRKMSRYLPHLLPVCATSIR